MEGAKPVVVVSKCITFGPVRWNAREIASDFVERLKPHADFYVVCPEVEIGLGVPRAPLRIVLTEGELRLVQPATGFDFTSEMRMFSDSFLSSLQQVDGFILKSGSPSCGIADARIYSGLETSTTVERGPGFFGKAVADRFPHLAVEDEHRLINPLIKAHFLERLFRLARLRSQKTGFDFYARRILF